MTCDCSPEVERCEHLSRTTEIYSAAWCSVERLGDRAHGHTGSYQALDVRDGRSFSRALAVGLPTLTRATVYMRRRRGDSACESQ